MAIQYVITASEMKGLLDRLKLQSMLDMNMLIGGGMVDGKNPRYEALSPDEKNRLNGVHRAFHMVCVRWAQEMGFIGGGF